MTLPKVSAILAVYNSEKTIVSCLETLLAQTIPLEIIVVDDGSTDHTKTLIVRIIEQSPDAHIRLLTQAHGGPALARNAGAQVATGDILLFVDADMTFDKDYARVLVAPITSHKVIGTYTREERVGNWGNPLARCWNYQEGWAAGKRFPSVLGPATDYRAITRQSFLQVGGFDNIGYTDTWTLFHKLRLRPLVTNAICYHQNPATYTLIFRQAKWAAKRPYKLGRLGLLLAACRTSVLPSLILGLAGALVHREPRFFFFKLVYDCGRFLGIIELLITGKLAK